MADELVEQPVYDRTFRSGTNSTIQENGGGYYVDVHIVLRLAKSTLKAARTGNANMWLYLAFQYRDYLHQPHEIRACWQWCTTGASDLYMWDNEAKRPPPEYERRT